MGLASIRVVVLGSISFLVFWVLAVFPAFTLLPIGRTAGALAGAVLTVVFKVETPTQAYRAIDLAILGLLFGTMMVSVYLEKADMFRYLAYALSWRSQGGKDLLCRGLLAPMLLGVFMNTILLLLTYWKHLSSKEDVTQLDMNSSFVKEQRTATPWTPFHSGGLFVQQDIFDGEALKSQLRSLGYASVEETQIASREDVASVSHVVEANALAFHKVMNSDTPQAPLLPTFDFRLLNKEPSQSSLHASSGPKWQRRLWKFCVYFVAALMLAALLYGLDMSWTALTAAVALMALDFNDAGPLLEKVSYPLLVFFGGMFISVDGFNKTGIPTTFWDAVEPYARTTNTIGALVLTLVVIILSNVASNVPTVLLLGSRVAESAVRNGDLESKAWLMLAWASTVGGNLTLVGSAANLIVSEQAAKAKLLGFDLTFFSHLAFGFPSTLIIAAAGLFLIRGKNVFGKPSESL
ncbi:hypothetical protein GOP47_0019047 [Adiantum capillus-veneris]|uniref:Citrate transporter-like domain-containing protein n=1 Tax=Adiantum capillus-veneris TaxID=13818 RepID=A0A9D4UFA6_ADICA|nr:hypothetical protein GOP47_0019047 [Adiantum capillus-veneris]